MINSDTLPVVVPITIAPDGPIVQGTLHIHMDSPCFKELATTSA